MFQTSSWAPTNLKELKEDGPDRPSEPEEETSTEQLLEMDVKALQSQGFISLWSFLKMFLN